MRLGWLLLFIFSVQAATGRAFTCQYERQSSQLRVLLVVNKKEFDQLNDQIERGMSLTLLNRLAVKDTSGKVQRKVFGCKVRPNLWEKTFVIERLGSITQRSQSSFSSLPAECREQSIKDVDKVAEIEMTTIVNPVSEQQLEITREWLAEKGIGAGSARIFGRAVSALVDLEADIRTLSSCTRI